MSTTFIDGWNAQQAGNIAEAVNFYKMARDSGDQCAFFHLNCMERYGQGIPIVINHKLNCRKIILSPENFNFLYQCYITDTPEIIFNRGILYELEHKMEEAKACFRKIEYVPALSKLASILHKEGNIEEANEFREKGAQAGSHFAQYNLGSWYLTNEQYEKAIYWLEKAVSQGFIKAQFNLGISYFEQKDYEKALPLFMKASESGFKYASHMLGYAFHTGTGVERDFTKAFDYYSKASEAGNPASYAKLGYMYKWGDGIPINYEEAIKWFQKADDAGYVNHGLGEAYLYGKGVHQNYEKAMYYFMKRANEEDSLGLYRVGTLYSNGLGVEQNFSLAISYYERAVKQQYVNAIQSLSFINTKETKITNLVKHIIKNNILDFNQFEYKLREMNIKNFHDPLVTTWIHNAIAPYDISNDEITNWLNSLPTK